MARWTLGWLLAIGAATAGAYLGTNEFVARQQDEGYAMRLRGARLGSPVCSQAARDLVAAGDGAAPTASPERQTAYARAARNVLQACSAA
ncbi:MAG TPA: hypothetical protein VKV73_13205 [Chloroflexota bacterium]|nr:hypothetical protein [Chloroflexota bacterium]